MKALFGAKGPPGWLVTGGIASVAVLYVFFAFIPAQKKIGSLRQQLLDKQQHVAASNELTVSLVAVEGRLEKSAEIIKKWQETSPAPQELSPVYAQISERARRAGVKIVRLEPQPPKLYSMVMENHVAVSLEGSFAGIFEFLHGVEELPQCIWMNNVSLERLDNLGSDLRCDTTLTIFGDLAENSD